MKIPIEILVIQESDDELHSLTTQLEAGGYQPRFERVASVEDFASALQKQSWDAVIANDMQDEFNALSALEYINKNKYDIPFIVVSSKGGEHSAVEAMRAGAHDYILKSSLVRLVPALEREMKEAEIRLARKKADETIERLSHHDQLTGLPNRTLLYDRLQQTIDYARHENKSFALLIMDLDRFKEVNDTIGHYYGDALLQQVAGRLQKICNELVTIARMGGDEFAIILNSANSEQALSFADKISEIFHQAFQLNGHRVMISASVGISLYPQHGQYADALLQMADVAMYRAKYANCQCALYDLNQDQHVGEQLSLVDDLDSAIDSNQLILHYQPIVDIKSRRVVSVEALVRWQHPKYGVLAPHAFVPMAQQTELIHKLSRWVLNASLSQLTDWHQSGMELSVAVNLPVRSLHDLQLQDDICDLLGAHGVMAKHLNLEITERTMMVDWLHAAEMIQGMAELGIRFTLDDFGTGHFSLGYLKKLPIDTLKIDKSFVMTMGSNKENEAIVKACVALGHCLDLHVLAQGVEQRDHWDLLVVHGCDKVQGNFISPPLPAQEMSHWLKHSTWNVEIKSKAKAG